MTPGSSSDPSTSAVPSLRVCPPAPRGVWPSAGRSRSSPRSSSSCTSPPPRPPGRWRRRWCDSCAMAGPRGRPGRCGAPSPCGSRGRGSAPVRSGGSPSSARPRPPSPRGSSRSGSASAMSVGVRRSAPGSSSPSPCRSGARRFSRPPPPSRRCSPWSVWSSSRRGARPCDGAPAASGGPSSDWRLFRVSPPWEGSSRSSLSSCHAGGAVRSRRRRSPSSVASLWARSRPEGGPGSPPSPPRRRGAGLLPPSRTRSSSSVSSRGRPGSRRWSGC